MNFANSIWRFFFFFMRKVVANSIGENDHCFLNHLYTIREQKKKKKVSKGHLIHLVGCFDDYCEVLELFTPFWRKTFWCDTSLRSFSLKCLGWRN